MSAAKQARSPVRLVWLALALAASVGCAAFFAAQRDRLAIPPALSALTFALWLAAEARRPRPGTRPAGPAGGSGPDAEPGAAADTGRTTVPRDV